MNYLLWLWEQIGGSKLHELSPETQQVTTKVTQRLDFPDFLRVLDIITEQEQL